MYICRTVPTGHVRRVPCHLPGMSKTQAVLWAPTFALQCCGRPQLPYQATTVKPPVCLWASTVLWVLSFAIHGDYGKTSRMHLTSIVLWALTNHLVPDGVGNKTK